jgi:hypothetical protein
MTRLDSRLKMLGAARAFARRRWLQFRLRVRGDVDRLRALAAA